MLTPLQLRALLSGNVFSIFFCSWRLDRELGLSLVLPLIFFLLVKIRSEIMFCALHLLGNLILLFSLNFICSAVMGLIRLYLKILICLFVFCMNHYTSSRKFSFSGIRQK